MTQLQIPLRQVAKGSVPDRVPLQFGDYVGLHLEFYRCILVQITLRCPLECEHCCVDAGPGRGETLREENLIAGIRSFAAMSSARLVCFTGGEPFSARSLLKRALSACVELGLQSYVITAVHWATSVAHAEKVLTALPPIALLSISTDRQHEKFVPLENVRNAIEAATNLGIEVNLLLTTENDGGAFEARLLEVLENVWKGLDIHRTPLGAVGRSKDEFISTTEVTNADDDGPCPLIGTPAVTASGSVCACCQVNETNLVSNFDHALNLGRMGVDSFSSMRMKISADPLLRAIRLAGPKWIVRRAQAKGFLTAVSLDEISSCKACSYVVRDPETARLLREDLASPAAAEQLNYLESNCREH